MDSTWTAERNNVIIIITIITTTTITTTTIIIIITTTTIIITTTTIIITITTATTTTIIITTTIITTTTIIIIIIKTTTIIITTTTIIITITTAATTTIIITIITRALQPQWFLRRHRSSEQIWNLLARPFPVPRSVRRRFPPIGRMTAETLLCRLPTFPGRLRRQLSFEPIGRSMSSTSARRGRCKTEGNNKNCYKNNNNNQF